jgi:ubiquitin C-terminal hydrolase
VLRKLWSKDNFKSVVSPQELIQEIVTASKRRFLVDQQAEASEILVWFLNELHRGLGGTRYVKINKIVKDPSIYGLICLNIDIGNQIALSSIKHFKGLWR